MSALTFLLHLLNFLAPALGLALLLPLADRFVLSRHAFRRPWWLLIAVNFLAGGLTLWLCLWWQGRDGTVVAYVALVLVASLSHWALTWRRA